MHGKEKIYCVTTNIINIQTKQLAFLSVDCSLKVMTRFTRYENLSWILPMIVSKTTARLAHHHIKYDHAWS